MINYSANFFFLLSVLIVLIGRLWDDSSGVGVYLGFAIAFCTIAAALHFRALHADRRLRMDVAAKKDAATCEAICIYFAGVYLMPRFFPGSYSDVTWSLFINSPRRRYWELISERLAFPNWVLALVLYFVIWVSVIEVYQGGLASRHVFALISNQALIEHAFVLACSWLAAIFLFRALMRAFLMLKKERL